MNDPREKLQNEGFSRQEVDWILERAVELQRNTEEKKYLDSDSIKEGAASAGIDSKFVEEAIRQVRAEMQREKAATEKRKKTQRYVAIGAAALVVVLFFTTQSRLNSRMSAVEAERAQLENVLQRRHDLIPNLISVARASASHEKELIESVSRYQSESENTNDFQLKQAWEQKLGDAMTTLMRSVGSSGGSGVMFTRLSDEMAGSENRIAYARKQYNEAVAAYNRTARGFPVSLIRPFTGYPGEVPFFSASPDAQNLDKF